MSPAQPKLPRHDEQLCFALYAATRAMMRTYKELLDPLGLTYPQYLVMLVLWEQDGLSVSEIGDKLMLDSGTLTPLLKRLELQGLLTRRRDKEDERKMRILLSPKGKALAAQVPEVMTSLLCQLKMPFEQITTLRDELNAITARLAGGEGCGEP